MPVDISVQITGLDPLLSRLRAVNAAIEGPALTEALYAGGQIVARYAKLSIQAGGKSGRLYRRGNRYHQASAPGEPPASDTGNLVASIGTRKADRAAIVYAAAEYARPLEFGAGRMAARPFLRPALDKHKDEVMRAIAETLRRCIEAAR